MDHAEYSQICAINWSLLKSMRVSPRQFAHDRDNPRPETDTLRVGLCIHTYVFEPSTFAERYIPYEGRRAGKAWEAFREEHADKTIMTLNDWARAIKTGQTVLEHPIAAKYLAGGSNEQLIAWTDDETGIACKGRIDHASKHLVDLKSTATIDPRQFAASAVRYGYFGQLAFYLDGCRACGLDVDDTPILIAVASTPPHDVIVYELPEHAVQYGRDLYRQLLRQYKECTELDFWPGIARDEVQTLEPPAWAYDEVDDDLELTIGGEAIGAF